MHEEAVLRQVAGLSVRCWGQIRSQAPVVLALHGLTSTSAVWADLGARSSTPVLAVDLPGRGGSVDVPAGPGLPGLAQAVLEVADALELQRVLVVGHSMGAFLAPLVLDGLGRRCAGTVLLDGGVRPEPSVMLRPVVVRALFGVQMWRLVRDWPDIGRYTVTAEGEAAANRPDLHEGFAAWSRAVLRRHGTRWYPALDRKRIVADAVDSLTGTSHLPLLAESDAPVHLVAAAHGADDGKPAFLSATAIEAGGQIVPHLTWERVQGNHATMLFDPAVAQAVGRTRGGGQR